MFKFIAVVCVVLLRSPKSITAVCYNRKGRTASTPDKDNALHPEIHPQTRIWPSLIFTSPMSFS